MAKKIKNQVEKSTNIYDATFANAVWQSDEIAINQDTLGTSYRLYHDVAEANAEGVVMDDTHVNGIPITVDPPGGQVAAVLAVVAANTNEEKLSTLANAMMDVVADIEIADSNSKLFGGTKL